MTLFQARKLLIVASLTASAASFCFFVLAPVLGYPLRYAQAHDGDSRLSKPISHHRFFNLTEFAIRTTM